MACLLLPGASLAASVQVAAPCATARIWITQPAASGGFNSTWEVPECSRVGAANVDANVEVGLARRQQRMLGFGAALTGSAAWLLATRMAPAPRSELVRSLFAAPPQGIGLSLLRLPIGSTDLSRRRYSLAPVAPAAGDDRVALDLAPMRTAMLPVLREILQANQGLRIVASPWSAPAWMKTTGGLIGGRLQADHEAAFARYIGEFVDAMSTVGVPIFAVTLQNEPGYSPSDYPGMRMDAEQRARIIARYLGPRLARTHPQTTILGWDDNWDRFKQPLQVLADRAAAPFIGGVAWHCYVGRPNVQDLVYARYPDKWQLVTECSDGTWSPNSKESLADFANRVLIRPIRHNGAGTILWSLALDEHHGPHTGGCGRCIGVVTVDRAGRAEPTRDYYALAHFSAFVLPGAEHVDTQADVETLGNVGFISADGRTATLIVANRSGLGQRVGVALTGQAADIVLVVPAQSLATLQFRVAR